MATTVKLQFEEWYPEAHPRLVATLSAAFGEQDIAHEAAADAMIQALEQWARVSEMDSPNGWTYRVATNVARKRIRRKKIERRLLLKSAPEPHVSGPAGEIWHLVADLPERQRLAVVLRHVGHLSEPDIGNSMGIARGTVSATLRSAYKTLRGAIEEPGHQKSPATQLTTEEAL